MTNVCQQHQLFASNDIDAVHLRVQLIIILALISYQSEIFFRKKLDVEYSRLDWRKAESWKVMSCECVTEAADACQLRRCKYAEVSATLGHRVDELLVGIAKQIQLMARRRLGSSGRQPASDAATAAGFGDNARASRQLWSTVGRIKAATRFVVRGLLGKPPSSCSDLMKP